MLYDMWATDRFLDQLRKLDREAQKQVVRKAWEVLPYDPRDNGGTKKFLQGSRRRVKAYRLRSGDYRVIYTYDPNAGWVTLQAVDARGDLEGDGYQDTIAGVSEGPGDHRVPEAEGVRTVPEPTDPQVPQLRLDRHHAARRHADGRNLPRNIDETMLESLGVPTEFRPILRSCKTEDALLAAAVPSDIHAAVIDAVYADDPVILSSVRRWHVQDEESLLRWLQGDLATLLLDLDPEQEKHVEWSANSHGPTLLKGGPGSGKSVVAAYRARNLVLGLRKQGVERPTVLVTTFTNALANTLCRLVERLLGSDAANVEVLTSDQLVRRILVQAGRDYEPKDDGVARATCYRALQRLEGGCDEDRAHAARLRRFGLDYLREEVERVIVGRNLQSLDDYRAVSRAGRKVRFTGQDRGAVWRLAEEMARYNAERRQSTFAETRRDALRALGDGTVTTRYDGVVIDEAQDLDPNLLQIAASLCPSTDRLFVTADSDQSIYGGSFRWSEASKALRFTGRTGRLENCYRSTAQIASAARAWLAEAGVEPPEEVVYPRHGARPIIHAEPDMLMALDAVEAFLRVAMADLLVGAGSCCVLVPRNEDGPAVAMYLENHGLPARFMKSSSFDISAPGIKITTFHAAKGLEFPVVAVLDRPLLPITGRDSEEGRQERQEEAERDRRVRFVAMTRAMHALAYIRVDPAGLPAGEFPEGLWRSCADGWGGWLECEEAAGA